MPDSKATDKRLQNLISYLTPAVTLLNELHDGFGTPFIPVISNTTLSLIAALQTMKWNKDECVRLMENIHELLYTIVDLHIKSETEGTLPPAILHDIGKFAEYYFPFTCYKSMYGNKLKYLFRQSERNSLVNDCRTGLEEALQNFKIKPGSNIFNDITKLHEETQRMHKELLELISTLSDGTASDRSSISSSVYQSAVGSDRYFALFVIKTSVLMHWLQ
ncbi:hypothetical protein C8R44DRAFT_883073 [Mycena epipterygia]|nr:hypothetical protein C8R44DRAFT_883073 [Mycena epipterygia]